MTAALPRVIHLASAREWRGGQRQVLLLARGLARRSVDQLVITTAGSRLSAALREAGIPQLPVPWHRGLSWAALRALLDQTRLTPCLVHAHDPHALVLAGLGRWLGAKYPYVVTRRVDFHLRRKGFWVQSDRVIAISSAIRDILIADGVPTEKVSVVRSAIDVEATRQIEPGTIRRELGLPSGTLAVNVAALVGHKDQATLVRAAAVLHRDFPDLHWAVAGSGPLLDQLVVLARDLGVDGVIHFVGQLADPLPLIASADLFVMSSSEEGLGTSILDAMALGRPIVATAAGGIPEVVGGGAGLLAPIGDPVGLAAQIRHLLVDVEARHELGRRAGDQAQNWDFDGMAVGVLEVYRSVVIDD